MKSIKLGLIVFVRVVKQLRNIFPKRVLLVGERQQTLIICGKANVRTRPSFQLQLYFLSWFSFRFVYSYFQLKM